MRSRPHYAPKWHRSDQRRSKAQAKLFEVEAARVPEKWKLWTALPHPSMGTRWSPINLATHSQKWLSFHVDHSLFPVCTPQSAFPQFGP